MYFYCSFSQINQATQINHIIQWCTQFIWFNWFTWFIWLTWFAFDIRIIIIINLCLMCLKCDPSHLHDLHDLHDVLWIHKIKAIHMIYLWFQKLKNKLTYCYVLLITCNHNTFTWFACFNDLHWSSENKHKLILLFIF